MIETKEEIENASFRFEIRNENRARIFSPPGTDLNGGERIAAGERLHVEATIENRLTPDVYYPELRGQPPRRGRQRQGRVRRRSRSSSRSPGTATAARASCRSKHAVTIEDLGNAEHRARRSGQRGS